MQNLKRSFIVGSMLAVFSVSAMVPAFAGSEGRRNTALVLTAATIATAFQKNKTTAAVLGVGAVAAWNNADKARQHEAQYQNRRHDNRRDNDRRYEQRKKDGRGNDGRKYGDRKNDGRHEPRGHAYGHYGKHKSHRGNK